MLEDEERGRAIERLSILDVLVLAMERRHEVFAVVELARDRPHAIKSLRELLAVDELHARVVLDAQLLRFTVLDRERIAEQRDELRTFVESFG